MTGSGDDEGGLNQGAGLEDGDLAQQEMCFGGLPAGPWVLLKA